jgi:hypothetical protein
MAWRTLRLRFVNVKTCASTYETDTFESNWQSV